MEKASNISRVNLKSFIQSTKGEIFSAQFTKKNGEKRIMNARFGVKKGVTGKGSPNGLNTTAVKVFDMQKRAFRQINLASTTWIKVGGVKFYVSD